MKSFLFISFSELFLSFLLEPFRIFRQRKTHQASIIIHYSLKCVCFLVNAWSDVIMVEKGTAVTLRCSEDPKVTPRLVKWLIMGEKGTRWTMLLSVDIQDRANRREIHQGGRILEISDYIILRFTATEDSGGLYSCQMEKENKSKERIVLLAVVKR